MTRTRRKDCLINDHPKVTRNVETEIRSPVHHQNTVALASHPNILAGREKIKACESELSVGRR